MQNEKHVYFFGNGKADGQASMRELLGGKGANLAEMTNIEIPVPPGFTISTVVCDYFNKHDFTLPDNLDKQINDAMAQVEGVMEGKFGDKDRPLLVSVRSGAAVSMPGMMDTVLNLGLNDETVLGLAQQTNERLAYDSFRRFIDMFGDVVMHVQHEHFEQALVALKNKHQVKEDTDLSVDHLKELVINYKAVYQKHTGKPFPTDVREQLNYAIRAVFESWNKDKARSYRQINKLSGLLGTAVNVQAMVFGNMGDNSGTGVGFTRNPATGENRFFGEFLVNAQGEDVVAGIRTPEDISRLEKKWPEVYQELDAIRHKLERHYKDMQDIEFTIQNGKLFMLQTRNGKRTGSAAIKIAVDLVNEKVITAKEALLKVEGDHLNQLLFPVFDNQDKQRLIDDNKLLGTALPAGPGAACGQIVFSADDAVEGKEKGRQVILVRHETSPEDVSGMWAAEGVLTSTGGMTSHAAVVARGWGKPCIVGFSGMTIDYKNKTIQVANQSLKEGDWLSLDGSTGEVLGGQVATKDSPIIAGMLHGDVSAQEDKMYKAFEQIMSWSDEYRRMRVRTNADSPNDATNARKFGAEGIGLCRTEHMFFEGERIWAIREFILAPNKEAREKALERLLPVQREDFEGIFVAMNGLPVTIRLLDPPLHEFLPSTPKDVDEMAKRMSLPVEKINQLIANNHEMNPMLGHRGCRLSITFPELCVMQSSAIMEAACSAVKKGIVVLPEIMVPLIGTKAELDNLTVLIKETANRIVAASGQKVPYLVGTMIEIPRAAITADKVAETAEFFSFGTNDLTQMTFGYSRDDAGTFLPEYVNKGILPYDPFQTIDQEGVGVLVDMAVKKGRSVKPDLKLGVCGEHGGDPMSIVFFDHVGLDYVSSSPYRVPVARLAAAQATIMKEK